MPSKEAIGEHGLTRPHANAPRSGAADPGSDKGRTMKNAVMGAMSPDMAIDLGTASTLIHVRGRGVVCREPSAIAIHEDRRGNRRVLAVGQQAKAMLGRTPGDIQVLRPLKDGAITDFEVTEALLRHLMLQVQGRRLWVGPRVAVCIPFGTTEVERRAVRESAEASGAREVHLIEQPLAAAVGAGLPVQEAQGSMVVDIGAGTTEIAVLSLGGIVYSRTLKVGGEALDQAIIQHLRDRFGLAVGPQTAETVKLKLGAAIVDEPERRMAVKGRDLRRGLPRAQELSAAEVGEALAEPVQLIVEAVLASLEHAPPDLAADIAETGIVMTGGGALLRGLDRLLSDATNLPVVVTEEPEAAVVTGAGLILLDEDLLKASVS